MPSRFIETVIDIPAPPHVVWDVLTDFPAMADWNPFIRKITGEPIDGTRIRVTIQPPGRGTMSFRPRITKLEPRREFRWLGSLFTPGIFDGDHYFRLFGHPGGTRFEQGEQFNGMLVSLLMGETMLADTKRGFAAMNEALSRRCQSLAS
jgi:hypothetical protein